MAAEGIPVGRWSGDIRTGVDRTRSADWDYRSPGRRVASEDRRRTAEDTDRAGHSGVVMLEHSGDLAGSCPGDLPGDPVVDRRSGRVNPAVEPSRTWSVACRRDGSSGADSPAKGWAVRTGDSRVDLDTADLAADIPGSVHAAGTVPAAADSPDSGAASVEPAAAAAELRDVPVLPEAAPERAVPGWVAFDRRTMSTEAGPEVPLRGNLRPPEVAGWVAADGPGLWAADPSVVDLREDPAVAAAAAAVAAGPTEDPAAEQHLRREPLVDSDRRELVPVDRGEPDRWGHGRTADRWELRDLPAGRRALEDRYRAGGRAEAEEAPGCCAADRPGSPNRPGSGAAPRGTTCTRSPCPCSGSPGWSELGRRSRPGSSGCASDSAAAEVLPAASVPLGHPGCPGLAVAGIVAAASKRPTCLFGEKVSNCGRNFNRLSLGISLIPP